MSKLGLYIDLGFGRFAYCLANTGNKKILLYHCIETDKDKLIEDRIYDIYNQLEMLYKQYSYEIICIEEPCFNGENGAKLNRVLGMLYVLIGKYNLKYLTYNPKTMKKMVTGTGNANKKDVLFHVQKYFPLVPNTLVDDIIDSIGIYICYLIDNNLLQDPEDERGSGRLN